MALRRFAETGSTRRLPGDLVDRLRLMLLFLDRASSPAALLALPNYDAHQLAGNRAGIWSLTVMRKWRMTFAVSEDGAITDLDLEDYH